MVLVFFCARGVVVIFILYIDGKVEQKERISFFLKVLVFLSILLWKAASNSFD